MDGKEKVLKQFDFNNGTRLYWKIYYGYDAKLASNLAIAFDTYGNDIDREFSRKKLSEALDLLPPGDYLVQFKHGISDNTNIINTRFEIGHAFNPNREVNIQGPAMKGYLSPEQHQELVQAQIGKVTAEFQQQRTLDKMNTMLEEMRKIKAEKPKTDWHEIMKAGKEIIAEIKGLAALNNPAAPIAQRVAISGPKAQPDERTAQLTKMYQDAMAEWITSEGGGITGSENFMIQVWCLNEYRKKNPTAWEAIKPTIMKMAEEIPAETNTEEKPATLWRRWDL
jgi:exonuclease V gamma subunit